LIRKTRTCRFCGVAIEECPCVNWSRTPAENCPCCYSSGWVAIVRGRIAKTVEQFNDWAEARKTLWCELCGKPAPCPNPRCAAALAALAGHEEF
jgi:hypothetical protein